MSDRFVVAASDGPIAEEHRAVVAGIARTKRLVSTFDAASYGEEAIAKAREMWRVRMIAEYRSTAVFSGMVPQLMEARATIDTVTVVLRMAQDEVAHAEICAEALRVLGGDPVILEPIVSPPLAVHRGRSPEERALRNVIYGCCLTEVVNCARFVDVLEQMSDPYLHDVTRRLLADERLHGQFGFFYLEQFRAWLEREPEVRASLFRYLRHAFAVLERELSGAGSKRAPVTEAERALGIPDPRRLVETFYATVEGAIVPGLERFDLEAARAWKERSLESPTPGTR